MEQHAETVVVVAHPDDEVLWFASVLPRAGNVVIAFGPYAEMPAIGSARDRAVAELPFPTTFLRVAEAGTYATANWLDPIPSSWGIALHRASRAVQTAYEDNFRTVRDRLRGLLRRDQLVFSHNPWGEYGHEDHILIFRAVEDLRREIGFRHFVSPYVSDRSARLARVSAITLGQRSVAQPIDAQFAATIEAIYQKHGCWTWDSGWRWASEEWFFEVGSDRGPADRSVPVHLISVIRS